MSEKENPSDPETRIGDTFVSRPASDMRRALPGTAGLAIVLLVAALLRYGLLTSAYLHNCRLITYKSDDYEYHTLAVNILREHRFHLPDPRPGWQTRRTPGFPLLLAGIYAVTGPSPYRAAVVLVLISLATCAVTYVVGNRVFGHRVGLLAAFLMAVTPASVLYAGAILTDTLHTALLVLALLAIVGSCQSPHRKGFVVVGIVLGTAVLVRPASVYLPLVTALTAYAFCANRGLWVWMPIAAYAVVAPWCLRNMVVTGRFHLSTIGGYNLISYNLAYVKSAATGTDIEDVRSRYWAEASRLPGGAAELARREAKVYWRALLANQIRGAVKFWVRPGSALWRYYLTGSLVPLRTSHDASIFSRISYVLTQPAGFLVVGQAIFSGLTALGALAGMWLALRQRTLRPVVFISAAWCLYYALIAGPIPADRYHMPVEPILSLFAAHVVPAGLRRVGHNAPS